MTPTILTQPRRIKLHPKYKPLFRLDLPCRYFLMTGGRGSGKSFAQSLAVAKEQDTANYNTLYLRQTLVSAYISIIPEYWEKIEMLAEADRFLKLKTEVMNLNTRYSIYFRGIQTSRGSNEAQLKSIKRVGLVLVDEAQELTSTGFIAASSRKEGLRMTSTALLVIPATSTRTIGRIGKTSMKPF